MISCLCKALLRDESATHLQHLQNGEIRAVVKYLCKKGMPPKEIHEEFTETLGKAPPYSTEKKWSAELKRGRERVEDN